MAASFHVRVALVMAERAGASPESQGCIHSPAPGPAWTENKGGSTLTLKMNAQNDQRQGGT